LQAYLHTANFLFSAFAYQCRATPAQGKGEGAVGPQTKFSQEVRGWNGTAKKEKWERLPKTSKDRAQGGRKIENLKFQRSFDDKPV
jgi:hypothetical protein